MRFEKWHALGNDYVIVEHGHLPAPLTAAAVRALCDRHTGIGADGILELLEPDEPGFVARLRIYNPDGSEAELSGNGAREAIMYLRHRGWTDRTQFSIQTVAGEIRPTILSDTTCRVDMGRASLRSKDFPGGDADGTGEVEAGGRAWRFQHVSIGNPQCAIALGSAGEVDALDLGAIGPDIEHAPLFPNRTNVSWFAEVAPGVIRARIFERGVGETTASGTGASGAAIAYALGGGDSPVTVRLDGGELEVDVGEDLHIDLTGWAVPVYRGELSDADGVFAQSLGQ
jgi:diaminopimelate epimerase